MEPIRSDIGLQFIADTFQDYLAEMGIEHRRTTPLWPRANGKVERQNGTLLKAIRVVQVEGKDWREELFCFLLAYRSTAHSTTGRSPAELLFGRSIRCKLPALSGTANQPVRDKDVENKQATAEYANKQR